MNTFTAAYDAKVRPLMDKVDRIRSLLSSTDDGISFPSVVVVGDQSSGKSTLLESISLVELPKGSGIVTRCPLVLRLRKSNQRKVYRLHDGNKKESLDEKTTMNLLKYIEEETKKIAGNNKNVVKDLIELQVEDPSVRDLTVIDLPGIARNPIGDQPKDIHKQTTDLILHFIRQEGTVILCVFPANVDIATVESFTLAREVDPKGIRTIGVITKSDLAPNHDVLIQQLLMEKSDVLHLTLGFVAVRNRSTDENISLEDARKREKDFFHQHPASSAIGWHCLGIEALINRLADLYSDRVQEIFPKMRLDIQNRLKDVRRELSKFPPDLQTSEARLAKYFELADFYVENILKERLSNSNNDQHETMSNKLHEKFMKFNEIIRKYTREMFSEAYRSKVKRAMEAYAGEQLPNFLPYPVLKSLISEKIDQLAEATGALVNESFSMTEKLLLDANSEACQKDILLRKLIPPFRDIVALYLNEKKQTIHDQFNELIRLERHNPYTLNPLYICKLERFKSDTAHRQSNDLQLAISLEKEEKLYDPDYSSMLISLLIEEKSQRKMLTSLYSYWKALTIRFTDYAALHLRAGCDFDVCPGVRERLRRVPSEQCDFVDSYLAEDAYVRAKRQQLQATKERLEKVNVILGGHSIGTSVCHAVNGLMSTVDNSFMTLEMISKSLPEIKDDDDNNKPNISTDSASMSTTVKLNQRLSKK
ncbi:unnamed protein product [Rotaria sp. Silwood1]|nr:unnamed protein product [Rotaria sp. Silwood1]CAF3661867.1 unnamed protein product [Rotaria sp. Silwood1]CAF4924089.1 unnamed protein product [Rotaria sp. Silwood1]CAF5097415.1 unnamed protein product [Rotaria sp. Silwood1]